jgi:hypothetical protein
MGSAIQLDHLMDIVHDSLVLGAMIFTSQSAENFVLTEGKKRQAKSASDAHQAKQRAKKNELIEAIQLAALAVRERKAEMRTSEEYAASIRPIVLSHLGLSARHAGYPSVSTIKSTISSLKKPVKI